MKFHPQTYQDLLQYTDELSILQRYLPGVTVNKFFKSIFRDEDNASARLYYKHGKLMYNDFQVCTDVIGIVQYLFNESYTDTINRILSDFSSNFSKPIKTIPRLKTIEKTDSPTVIIPYYRDWREYDRIYWEECGGISLNWLESPEVNVKPFIKADITSKGNTWTLNADKLAYCYKYHIHDGVQIYKLYQPNENRERKWFSNVFSGVDSPVQLINTLPKNTGNELLVIGSSLKDSAVVQCNCNIWSCAPNNEGNWMPPQIIPKLNERFKRIITFFDNDNGGHRAAKKYEQKYGYEAVFIPDYYKRFKIKDPYELRKHLKNNLREFHEVMRYIIYKTK